jgi:acyl-CoA thioesterase
MPHRPDMTGPPIADSVVEMMATDAFSSGLGIRVLRARDGQALVGLAVTPELANGHGIAHGGVVFSLADTAFACACNSFGRATVGAAAEITFVAKALVGDELAAEAVLRTQFGRTGIYDVTVRRGADVIAEFRGRSHRLT